MTRLSVMLLMGVLASALYLVHVQYESRRLFTELERARNEAHRLEVERDRLQVEKRAQATPLRVEQLARNQLKMQTATPAITQYIGYPNQPQTPAAAAIVTPAAPRGGAR
ncbi:cell division protein FtsL [Xylophilus sp. GW821-FHT01B05]